MSLRASYQIVLDTRRIKKNRTYPVKIRITFNRKAKYYNTGYAFTESDYNSIISIRPKKQWKDLRLELSIIEKKAHRIINELKDVFTFESFEKRFRNNPITSLDVFYLLKKYAENLEKEDRYSSASLYKGAISSIKNFIKKERLSFNEITPTFLRSYQKHMIENGKSISTVGIYLRNVRTIVNQAIREGIIKPELSPFGRGKYQIPNSKNIKRALRLAEIEKIFNYLPEKGSTEHFAKDIWIFSYLCNGINLKDIFLLKYKDVQNERISIRRSKTIHSSREQKTIEIPITQEITSILDRWGTKPKFLDNYIFPVFKNKSSEIDRYKVLNNTTSLINKHLKRIASKIGVEKNLSSISARHSYATVLKTSGVAVAFISDSLGHSNIKTTENYFSGFEDEAKKEIAKKLIDFKKVKNA